jgi:hypothetical protein
MKSVSFSAMKEVRYIPAVETTNKIIFPEKNLRSFANVELEIKQRRRESIKNAQLNAKSIRHNIRVLDETLKGKHVPEDVVYFKNLRSEALFDLKMLMLKLRYYRHMITESLRNGGRN